MVARTPRRREGCGRCSVASHECTSRTGRHRRRRTPTAAANSRPPLLVLEPLRRFLDEHGIGAGEIRASPIGEGHSNVTYLIERGGAEVVLRRPPRPPLPPSAHDVLREARLLRALQDTARAGAGGAGGVRGRGDDRLPVLRDGADPGRGDRLQRARAAGQPGAAPPDRRAADRGARRDPRGRLAGRRAWRASASRPATWSASCAASAACGSSTRRARSRRSSASARGWPRTCPSPRPGDDRPRGLPPGQHDLRRPSPPRTWRRCSTGRWPRSATRWRTSGICA